MNFCCDKSGIVFAIVFAVVFAVIVGALTWNKSLTYVTKQTDDKVLQDVVVQLTCSFYRNVANYQIKAITVKGKLYNNWRQTTGWGTFQDTATGYFYQPNLEPHIWGKYQLQCPTIANNGMISYGMYVDNGTTVKKNDNSYYIFIYQNTN